MYEAESHEESMSLTPGSRTVWCMSPPHPCFFPLHVQERQPELSKSLKRKTKNSCSCRLILCYEEFIKDAEEI